MITYSFMQLTWNIGTTKKEQNHLLKNKPLPHKFWCDQLQSLPKYNVQFIVQLNVSSELKSTVGICALMMQLELGMSMVGSYQATKP